MSNVFAWVATDPKELKKQADIVGRHNNGYILEAAQHCNVTVCAWGINGNIDGRGKAVEAMLRAGAHTLYAIKLCKDGTPQHPLYLSGSRAPFEWGHT